MAIDLVEVNWALENGEFLPYFQPQVQLRSGKLTGFEVLARWNHATKGIIPPDDFIPLAERDGWIHALTSQILEKAFSSALPLPSALQLSVNISPIQLRDRSLAKQFEEVARLTGFSLERVMVEITESAMTDNLAQARLTAEELKELGCKLTLDDFGTGYSSLRHLQSLPFDELKVDKSFVSSMVQKRDSRKIVAAVVGLGQSLGLATVAEGVESHEQAEMLAGDATLGRAGSSEGRNRRKAFPPFYLLPSRRLPPVSRSRGRTCRLAAWRGCQRRKRRNCKRSTTGPR